MPKDGISLYFTITDRGSSVLKSIGDQTKSLDKETQQLTQACAALDKANEPLIKRQTELKGKLEASKVSVKDAAAELRRLGDEASQLSFEKAVSEQDALRQELRNVEGQIKSNQKTYQEYQEKIRKGANEYGGSSGSSASSMFADLASAGAMKALGGAASQLAGIFVQSAGGSEASTIFSSVLSQAGTGAAIGSMILPGIGTAIGAALGGALGAVTGSAENWAARDDAFIAYYNQLYEGASSGRAEDITSGSGIAGSREQIRFAFAKRFGSDEASLDYMEQIRQFALQTNYTYDELVSYAKQLLVGYGSDETFRVLQDLSDATAGLNLDSSDNQQLISVLNQMQLADSVTQHYLRQFRDRGLDVNSALAGYLGVDAGDITGMVTAGKISGADAAEAILRYIEDQYGGLSVDLMGTFDALTDNLEDYAADLQNAAGEAYNEMRKESLAAETDAYEGPLGEAMMELSRITGETQAYMDNLADQYKREALAAVLLGDEVSDIWSSEAKDQLSDLHDRYAAAQTAYENGEMSGGRRMQEMRELAETVAAAAYDSSDAAQDELQVRLDQLAATRALTSTFEGWENEYRLQREQEKGLGNATFKDLGEGALNGSFLGDEGGYFDVDPGSFAVGLNRVPYNNFPALLHEDERVLTAREARNQDAGNDGKIVIEMYGTVIREEADIERVASELLDKLQMARLGG